MSEQPQQQQRQSGRSKILLVADDSKATQKVVALTFEDEGWRVLVASDAEEAWQQFETDHAPDIVLADVFMPGDGGGLELCRRIKTDSRFRHIPVVLLVGTFEPFDKAEARRVGADDLLTKPFQSIRDLVGRIGSLFDGQSKERSESSPMDERTAATVVTSQSSSVAPSDTEQGKQTKNGEVNLIEEASARDEAEADKDKSDDATNATAADRFADQTFDDQLIEAVPAAHFGAVATENVTPVETNSFDAQQQQHHTPQTLTLFEPTDELDKPDSTNHTELSSESPTESAQNEESSEPEFIQSQVAQTTPLDPDAAFVRADDDSERTNEHGSSNQNSEIQISSESQSSINAPDAINSMDDGGDDNDDVLLERNQTSDQTVASPTATDTQTNTMPHTSYSDHDNVLARESFAEDALLDIDDSIAPFTSHAANDADVTDDFVLDLPDDGRPVDQNAERASLSSTVSQSNASDDALDLLDVGDMNATALDVPAASLNEIPVSSIEVQTHHTHVAAAESDVPTVSADTESHSRETNYQVGDSVTETPDSFAQFAPSVQPVSAAGATDIHTHAAGHISPEQIEQIARRVVEMMSERVVQEIAWEVVPQLAELLVKQRLDQEKLGKE